MCRDLHKATGMKNQGNMSLLKEYSKLLVTGPKEAEMQKLPDKEFKRNVSKMLRELQENTDKIFNNIKETTEEQNQKFNKEIGGIKNN